MAVIAEEFKPRVRLLVNLTGDFALAEMQRRAPVKTGKMKRSIRKTVSGFQAVIEPTVPYAIHVEEGTAPHIIRASKAKALRFEAAGEIVFCKLVHHPGTKPQPFVRETAEETRRQLPQLWQIVWMD